MPTTLLHLADHPLDGAFQVLLRPEIVRIASADPATAPVEQATLALLELPLEGWPGVSALTRLRARAPSLPVVVVTEDDAELAQAALVEGAEDHLVRGHFDEDALLRCLRQASGRARRRLVREAHLSEAAQTDRLDAVGLLATGMAHEINNPLTYVLGNLDLAQVKLRGARRPGRSPEEVAAAIDAVLGLLATASQGAQRVRTVVRDLNTFGQARAEADTAAVSVRAAVDWVVAVVGNAGPPVQTELVGPLLARGDEARIGQVLLALVRNAFDAVRARPGAGRVRISARNEGSEVVVQVEDEGCGIAPDVLPRVFDPFFTTKGVGEGAGLGLFMARNLVRAMGGRLEVESIDGGGTTSRVRLVALSEPKPMPVQRSAPAARLLVLDDDALVLESLRTCLAERFDVVAVPDVGSAREALARGTVDFLLLDLMMPDRSSIGFYESLRARRDPMAHRVIFMTGGAFSPEARHFVRTIPNPCLGKPFADDELAAAMEACRRLGR